jgi:transcriptional regulator
VRSTSWKQLAKIALPLDILPVTAIAHSIERTTDDLLKIDHGSLYPALHRLGRRGWITSKWGTSENNRRAKFYRLTAAGRKQLVAEVSKWERMVKAVGRVVQSVPEEG